MAVSAELAAQLLQVSASFVAAVNIYLGSQHEIQRRARRLRKLRMLLMMQLMENRKNRLEQGTPKRIWALPTHSRYWEEEVPRFTEAQFQKEFHVGKRTFQFLCNSLKGVLSKKTTKMRAAIPLEKRVAVALAILASKNDYGKVAEVFGVGKSTVCNLFKQFCSAVVAVLFGKVVQLPSGKDFREEADKFTLRWSFPDCIGVVGATHLPIATPRNGAQGYANQSGWNSIVLLGVASYSSKLGYVCIGQPGSTDNASVLEASQLYKTAYKGKLFPAEDDLHFIADPSFPLQRWLLTPYLNSGYLTHAQQAYNMHLANAHKCIDTTLQRLKGRWSLLLKGCDLALDFTKVVQVCCVLHNLCETAGDMFFEQWYDEVRQFDASFPPPVLIPPPMTTEVSPEAVAKRDRLADRLAQASLASADMVTAH